MKDGDKTKEQLRNEHGDMCQRTDELLASGTRNKPGEEPLYRGKVCGFTRNVHYVLDAKMTSKGEKHPQY